MKILKYAAVAAMAIGLCAKQCHGLTPGEKWVNDYVSKITGDKKDEQKKLVASYLFWEMRYQDASTVLRATPQTHKVQGGKIEENPKWHAASVAVSDAAKASENARNAILIPVHWEGMTYESYYIALWNSDKDGSGNTFGDRILNNQDVLMPPAGTNIKFKAPTLKVRPLYP